MISASCARFFLKTNSSKNLCLCLFVFYFGQQMPYIFLESVFSQIYKNHVFFVFEKVIDCSKHPPTLQNGGGFRRKWKIFDLHINFLCSFVEGLRYRSPTAWPGRALWKRMDRICKLTIKTREGWVFTYHGFCMFLSRKYLTSHKNQQFWGPIFQGRCLLPLLHCDGVPPGQLHALPRRGWARHPELHP